MCDMHVWSSFSEADAAAGILSKEILAWVSHQFGMYTIFCGISEALRGQQWGIMQKHGEMLAPKWKYKIDIKQRNGNTRMALPEVVKT